MADNNQKKQRILITVDQSIYSAMKNRKIKASTYINQMLKIALLNDNNSTYYNNQFSEVKMSAPAGIWTRVAASKGQNDSPDYTTGAIMLKTVDSFKNVLASIKKTFIKQ